MLLLLFCLQAAILFIALIMMPALVCCYLCCLELIILLDVNIAIHHIIDMLCDTNQIALPLDQD